MPDAPPTFVSTRGAGPVSFADALLRGLAPDGGLYVPEAVPKLPGAPPELPRAKAEPPGVPTELPKAAPDSLEGGPGTGAFARSARWANEALLAGAMPGEALAGIVHSALDFEVPLVEVEEGVHVLELFHGPTLAFKDVGARFMARAMGVLGDGPRVVLVATSGDTGGAVASAFHGLEGVRVIVLFPADGISVRQRRQMTTLGGNVTAVAVDGTFDNCQHMAKTAFAEEELRAACRLTSANSINVGRLIPQTFYYVHAAGMLGWDRTPPTFVVPSGNLGNLCAGLLAHRAGLPAAGFVAAVNANRVFPDYLASGHVQARPSVPTASNAMDVGDPSNLERIRWLYGGDVVALRRDVTAISSDDGETRATIADVYQRTGYVLDPHTAVGYAAAKKAGLPNADPTVILATAHPAKFPEIVEEATGLPVPLPSALADRMEQPEHWMDLPPSAAELRDLLMSEDST